MTAPTITDLFCGAGGSSLGAEAAGGRLVMAANHWQRAIDVHQANFPDAGHDCADISQADPRRYPVTDILLASPECFTAGHLVTTVHGQVPIEQLEVGTLVLTHTGHWRPIVRVQTGVADTVIVKGQGHTGIECTLNHRFWAMPSERRWHNDVRDYRRVYDSPDWVRAEHLVERAALWSTPIWYAPLTSAERLTPPKVFGSGSAAWWLVGRWLGDGSLTIDDKSIEISCGYHEADVLRARLQHTGARWSENQKRTAVTFTTYDLAGRDWLLDNCGRNAGSKLVPSAALTLPVHARQALLDGYISADGSIAQRRVRCSTISRSLAVSVRLLAESLGHRVAMAHDHRTTYQIEGRTGVAQVQWILHWEPQLSDTRSPEAFVRGVHAWSRIRSVAPGRTQQTVYNIEVDVDHSYVLDGIVVANCTNHSQARGVSRKRQDPTLWDAPDPAAERSRATMWDVVRFAEQIPYAAIVVENVVEATKWVLWQSWWQSMEALGYRGRIVSANSMHHGVPQSRDRIYVVWTRNGLKVNLDHDGTAWCPRCERVGRCRQSFKPGRKVGRYRSQWIWTCTTCTRAVEPATVGAAAIIDWSLACPRIGGRARPLAPATRSRILAGLQRYGWAPVTTSGAGNVYETTPGNRARPLDEPLATQQTSATSALATPPGFLFQSAHGGRVESLDAPHPTVCASDDRHALVLANTFANVPTDVVEPIPTVTTGNRHALVVPLRTNGIASSTDEVVPTVTAGGNHHALLMRNNSGAGEMVTPVTEPARTMTTAGHQSLLVPTVPTRDRFALVDVEEIVDDCGFRMLEPYEVAAAMAFPTGYIPRDLPKKDQVKLAGNAVTPPVMTFIVERIVDALEGRS